MRNNTKQIDVVTQYFYPVAAGIEMNIMEVYSNLIKKGWDVTVHTSDYDYTTKNRLKPYEEINGIKVKRYPMWKFYFWPGLNLNHGRIICLHNFNIIPHLNIMAVSAFLKLLGLKNFSLFLIPHGGFSPEWTLFRPLLRFVKSTYHKTLGVFLINRSIDGVRAVAKWEGQEMIRMGVRPDLVSVITNGIEKEAYFDIESLASPKIKNLVKNLGLYVVQIGRIYAIKDQETAIKALSHLPGNLKLVLVGPTEDTGYKVHLESLVRELNLEGRVIFLGVLRGIDKYYLVKKALCMVHMAIWEGNANVINEAFSQGVLCVVANSLGLNEQITNGVNGYLVPQKDYMYLAEVISGILKNPDSGKILKMRLVNRKYASENSWSKVAERVENLYTRTGMKKFNVKNL